MREATYKLEALKTRDIPDSYYDSHIPIIRERIEMAGIRLAGVLNGIFDGK